MTTRQESAGLTGQTDALLNAPNDRPPIHGSFMGQRIAKIYAATVIFITAAIVPAVHAATYTCQDRNGVWTAEACKGRAAPPPIAAPAPSYPDPFIGMTAEQASQITGPRFSGTHDVRRTKTPRGIREQWIFRDLDGVTRSFLYFDDGVLTAIQD